jgi:diaminopimelate decarboxylase
MKTHNSERVSAWLGGCDPSTLAREFGTPLLVIDEVCLRSRMRRFRSAFEREGWRASVTYAGKALLISAIARIAHDEGLDVDVCSLAEFETALRGGVPADRCIVHGCYKTEQELRSAVARHARHVVVDNAGEIAALSAIARDAQTTCDVLVRVNPSIAASTHRSVQTSAPASKFGFAIADGQAMAAVRAVSADPALVLSGIHCHLGSQIRDMQAYVLAVEALSDFAEAASAQAGIAFGVIDLGGGLAADAVDAPEGPQPEEWAGAIYGALERRFDASGLARPHIYVEPGRALVADAGTTLYTIGVRKRLPDGTIALIIDGGMSDNPRPALYEARYQACIAGRPDAHSDGVYTVFGRHCETDRLIADVPLPDPQPGDILAVRSTGAYTYSMASNYNRFPRPAVVLAHSGSARVIARREPIAHIIDLDVTDAP